MARQTIYKERSRVKAAFLAFFGGTFGLHKFYLRDTGGGIFFIMMAIVTSNIFYGFPLSALLGFFDAMKLMMMPDSEFDRKYNRHLLKQNRSYRQTPQRQVVQKKTKRVRKNPFKKSGIKKYKEYALEEAIEDFKKALEVDSGDPELHFDMAGAYSLTEKKDLAYFHLSKAVELGFKDFDKIQTHDDLAYVRIQPEYEAFKNNNYSKYSKSTGKPKEIESSRPKENLLDNDVLLSQLNKLKELRDKGVLTEKDYVSETRKLTRKQY